MQNLKPLASLCSWAGWFESYLVKHPKDRFSRDEAHFICPWNNVMFLSFRTDSADPTGAVWSGSTLFAIPSASFGCITLRKSHLLELLGDYSKFSCVRIIAFLQYPDCLRKLKTRRGSSIGSEFAWHASSPEFDPHVRHILSWRLGHENISTAILPLLLIQEEQLSVTGESMCTKYW